MFSLIDFNIHESRSGLGVVTGAKMIHYYGGILKDYTRMELASEILKEISRVSESSDSKEYFDLVDQSLPILNGVVDVRLVRGWFGLTLLRVMGEEVNLYRDVNGVKLSPDKNYEWDINNEAFRESINGKYGVDEIKMLRLMSSANIEIVNRIKIDEIALVKIMEFIEMVK